MDTVQAYLDTYLDVDNMPYETRKEYLKKLPGVIDVSLDPTHPSPLVEVWVDQAFCDWWEGLRNVYGDGRELGHARASFLGPGYIGCRSLDMELTHRAVRRFRVSMVVREIVKIYLVYHRES